MTSTNFFVAGLILALGVVATVLLGGQHIANSLLIAGAPQEIANMVARSPVLQLALGLSAAALTMTLVALVLPALLISGRLLSAARQVEASDNAQEAADQPAVKALFGAASQVVSFDPNRIGSWAGQAALVERPLRAGLFSALVWALPASGVILGLIETVGGLLRHIQSQSVFERLANEPILTALAAALTGLVALLLAALLVRILLAVAMGLCERPRQQLSSGLMRLLPDPNRQAIQAGFADLAGAQAKVLSPAVAELKKAISAVSASQTSAIAQLSDALIDSVGDKLGAVGQARLTALRASLDELCRQVDTASAAIGGAADGLTRSSNDQAVALGEQVSVLMRDLKQTLGGQSESIAQMHQAAIDLLKQAADRTAATVDLLSTAIEREQDSADRVGLAAEQMQAAATVSRETVERFIALAERMRELSRSIGSAVVGSGLEDQPLANPRTSKRLSSAIRELQRAADNGLPELK